MNRPLVRSSKVQQQQRKERGRQGEEIVEAFLIEQGYTILARNFSWRGGEIDIIARKDRSVAFVEVKTRATAYFALSAVITPQKQRKLIMTARRYVLQQELHHVALRFDIALVEPDDTGGWQINYVTNAFTDLSEADSN